MTMAVLKTLCETLDLEKTGTKDQVVPRIMSFLMDPQPSGRELPKAKAAKSKSKTLFSDLLDKILK